MGHDGNSQETILCLDANTGATISSDHVYALSKDGHAFCLNAKNGDAER
ncbi:MAG: hypothetical protein ACKVGW_19925 [Verrucomicrobiia bacterium]|jgi:outer membrane protein assembly factor BamB|tara:strand:+ start:339 stop:485 length:147 start_codon:yes stop_codon:yes gene_type:complete